MTARRPVAGLPELELVPLDEERRGEARAVELGGRRPLTGPLALAVAAAGLVGALALLDRTADPDPDERSVVPAPSLPLPTLPPLPATAPTTAAPPGWVAQRAAVVAPDGRSVALLWSRGGGVRVEVPPEVGRATSAAVGSRFFLVGLDTGRVRGFARWGQADLDGDAVAVQAIDPRTGAVAVQRPQGSASLVTWEPGAAAPLLGEPVAVVRIGAPAAATGGGDGPVVLVGSAGGPPVIERLTRAGELVAVGPSSVAYRDETGMLRVRRDLKGVLVPPPSSDPAPVGAPGRPGVVSADGAAVAFWRDGQVWIVDARTGAERATPALPEPATLAFRPNGELLALGATGLWAWVPEVGSWAPAGLPSDSPSGRPPTPTVPAAPVRFTV